MSQNQASVWLILPFYLGVVCGPQEGSCYLFTFLPLPGGGLWSRIGLQDVWLYLFTLLPGGGLWPRIRPLNGSYYLFAFLPFYQGVVCFPESGFKTAHFTFLPFYLFTLGWSVAQNRPSRCLILPFYHFTWGWYVAQNQASRRLILPFYLLTFLPGGSLWPRTRPQDGSFYLFNFLPFLPGGSLWPRIRPQDGSFYLLIRHFGTWFWTSDQTHLGPEMPNFMFLPFYLFSQKESDLRSRKVKR